MSAPEVINPNSSYHQPFKTDHNIVKSTWKSSVWCRRQVRILIESSGELVIQTVAQHSLARLVSAILKCLSCGRLKSFGKKVEALSATGYLLPSNLSVPLSEKKQKELFDLQCKNLALIFLPSYKNVSDLGVQLCDYAIKENGDQEVMQKVMDMHQQILTLQLSINEEVQKDITPAELYKQFQAFEQHAKKLCEQYPADLKALIEEKRKAKSEADLQKLESVVSEKSETPNLAEPPTSSEAFDPSLFISSSSSALKKNYFTLLKDAKNYVVDLRNRLQLISADWLEQEIEKKTHLLSLVSEDDEIWKSAIESLEDALDSTDDRVSHVTQLLTLPENSPHEAKLKAAVIADTRQTLIQLGKKLDAKKEKIDYLLQSSEKNHWSQTLDIFFKKTHGNIETLSTYQHAPQPRILGSKLSNPWAVASGDVALPLVELERLDRLSLARHKADVEEYCRSALNFVENETQVESIFQLRSRYDQLSSIITSKIPRLKRKGQYLHVCILENCRDYYQKVIKKTSSSLSRSASALNYKKALQTALKTMRSQLIAIKKNPEIDPFEQLTTLKKLGSPYYSSLHLRLVNNAKTQIKVYIDILSNYLKIISAAMPHIEANQRDLLNGIMAIEAKIQAKMTEISPLNTTFNARLHVWQPFNSPVPLEDLTPSQLNDYLNSVSRLTKGGIEEINQEAANMGFSFD